MLRKLTEGDRRDALEFLGREPAYNVFAMGDIEHYGFAADYQDVWGQFDGNGRLWGLMLRYHDSYVVYSPDDAFDISAMCDILEKVEGEWMLSGKEVLMERLCPALGLAGMRRHALAVLYPWTALPEHPSEAAVEWIPAAEFDDILELRRTIEEFRELNGSSEILRHNIETGAGRTNAVRRNGKVIATASSAAENALSAMIIGVCTAQGQRRRGLATACVTALCRALLREGKKVCLFYENPEAARIYKRLGFRDQGRWGMVRVGG